MRVPAICLPLASLTLGGCIIPRPYDAAAYTKHCTYVATPEAGTILAVTVRLPKCRAGGVPRMTYLRTTDLMFAAIGNNDATVFLTADDWNAAVDERLKGGPPIIFIHGFNNDASTALARARAIQIATGRPVVAVLWPSYGNILKYSWDEANADWSTVELRDWFDKFLWSHPHLSLVAHSMGNRIAFDLVRSSRAAHPGKQLPIDHLVMAAPDIDRAAFARLLSIGQGPDLDTTIYVSTHDQAMSASWRAHGNARAGDLSAWVTGHTAQYVLPAENGIAVLDTSLLKGDSVGHATFITSNEGAADLCRVINGKALLGRTPLQTGYWQLERNPAESDACTETGRAAANSLR